MPLYCLSHSFVASPLCHTAAGSTAGRRAVVRLRRPTAAVARVVCSERSASSLYEALGIPTSASGVEIKAAYRRLARTWHPDVAAENQKEWSANEFMKIHAAYSTLSDPEKRARYDRDLFRLQRRFASSSAVKATVSGGTRRNWETDQCW